MNLHEAQAICRKLEAEYFHIGMKAKSDNIKWDMIYDSVDDIMEDLKKVYIPKGRTAPAYTFIGYDFIYSFAYYVQKGWKLSPKQMTQAKRLAKEIKKASAISEYHF